MSDIRRPLYRDQTKIADMYRRCASRLGWIALASAISTLPSGCGNGSENPGDRGPSRPRNCAPLPMRGGAVHPVNSVELLRSALRSAQAGDEIALAAGEYDLGDQPLVVSTPGLTLRGENSAAVRIGSSGERPTGTILDGLIQINADDVYVSDLTISRSPGDGILIGLGDFSAARSKVHRVSVIDSARRGVVVKGASGDLGEVTCSSVVRTSQAPTWGGVCEIVGIDLHSVRDFRVADSELGGFYCLEGGIAAAIRASGGSRGTVVERNSILDSAVGIEFGIYGDQLPRTYSDAPCGQGSRASHIGGWISNNFVSAGSVPLLESIDGVVAGISIIDSCGDSVLHNSVVLAALSERGSLAADGATTALFLNNLTTGALKTWGNAQVSMSGNLGGVSQSLFLDPDSGDLHLAESAAVAIDKAVLISEIGLRDDIDGQPRSRNADIGADERSDEGRN